MILGRTTDVGDADEKQMAVEKDEVIRPMILAWVKQADHSPTEATRHPLGLRGIAGRTGPGEIVDVIRPSATRQCVHPREAARYVVRPEHRWNDVIHVELARRGSKAVLADVAGTEMHEEPHDWITVRTGRQTGQPPEKRMDRLELTHPPDAACCCLASAARSRRRR